MRLEYRFTKHDLDELCRIQEIRLGIPYVYLCWVVFSLLGLGICLLVTRMTGVITYSVLSVSLFALLLWFYRQNWNKTKNQASTAERVVEIHEKYIQFWAAGVGTRTAWWWVTSFETKNGFWVLRHNESFSGIIPVHAVAEKERAKVEALIRERIEQAEECDDTLELGQVNWNGERMRRSHEISRDEFVQITNESRVTHQDTPPEPTKKNSLSIVLITAVLLLILIALFYGQQVHFDLLSMGIGIMLFFGMTAIWIWIVTTVTKRINAQTAAQRSDDEFEDKTTCIWTADGIVLASRCTGTLLSWSGIKGASQTKLTIRLEREDYHYNYIPKHVFDNDEVQISEFVTSVNECIEMSTSIVDAECPYDEKGNPYQSAGE
jgi:hypothetical protein